MASAGLADRALTYGPPGVTRPEDAVWSPPPGRRARLTLRSVTAPGSGLWRLAFPGVLVAQRWYRRRYARALAGR